MFTLKRGRSSCNSQGAKQVYCLVIVKTLLVNVCLSNVSFSHRFMYGALLSLCSPALDSQGVKHVRCLVIANALMARAVWSPVQTGWNYIIIKVKRERFKQPKRNSSVTTRGNEKFKDEDAWQINSSCASKLTANEISQFWRMTLIISFKGLLHSTSFYFLYMNQSLN